MTAKTKIEITLFGETREVEGFRGDGRADNLYDRVTVRVRAADGQVVDAIAYRMSRSSVRYYADLNDGRPIVHGGSYLAMMCEGREAFGLPTDDLPVDRDWAA